MRSLEFNLIGEANVDRHAVLLRVQPVQPLLLPRGPGPQERLHAEQAPAGGREGKGDRSNLRNSPPGRSGKLDLSPFPSPFNPERPAAHLANRKAPMARLMTKLGLRQFRNVGPLRDTLLPADRVGVKLKQHLGAPCEPLVGVGQRVTKGQVIGRPPVTDGKPALGAPVHASIDGAGDGD